MLILGISSFYHDAAACLIRDGELVAAAEEERFTRRKHDSSFPRSAIAYCLQEAGATPADIDFAVFYERPRVKLARVLFSCLAGWPNTLGLWSRAVPAWLRQRVPVRVLLRREFGKDPQLLFCDHHLAHAAAAFLPSPYDEAVVLTLDGVGEWTTTAFGLGRGGSVRLDGRLTFPHSLGLFYSALTSYLGFHVNDAEWKVMGLAAYGSPVYLDRFRQLLNILPDGSFRLNLRYFDHQRSADRLHSPAWERLFGRPARSPETELDSFHCDVACSGQRFTEEVVLNLAQALYERYRVPRLCLAGGVALNGLANWAIRERTPFREVFVPPSPGDSGGALGAALLVDAALSKERRVRLDHAFFGPAYDASAIADALARAGLVATLLPEQSLLERTVELLVAGNIVAWFQGRMEFGPRALGARSILCDPRRRDACDTINRKVKFREWFRPFAPAVPRDLVHRYFDVPQSASVPFMNFVPRIRPQYRDLLPAVTHIDGTSRIQTLTEKDNGRFHRLVRLFGERTGVFVLLNTSFNVRGEPIVCSPADACRTFLSSGLDAMVIGDYLVTSKPATVDIEGGAERSAALEKDLASSRLL